MECQLKPDSIAEQKPLSTLEIRRILSGAAGAYLLAPPSRISKLGGRLALGSTVVAVLAKRPDPGRVKTRLGRVVGDDVAAQLASAFLSDTTDRLLAFANRMSSPAPRIWLFGDRETPELFCDGLDGGYVDALCQRAPSGLSTELDQSRSEQSRSEEGRSAEGRIGQEGAQKLRYAAQADGHLGIRMNAAALEVFQLAPETQQIVFLGADTPHLPLSLLNEAVDALDRVDVVVGPSSDGGFYLLGARWDSARDGVEAVFRETQWGDPGVLQRTENALKRSLTAWESLREFDDFDEISDLVRWLDVLAKQPAREERTKEERGLTEDRSQNCLGESIDESTSGPDGKGRVYDDLDLDPGDPGPVATLRLLRKLGFPQSSEDQSSEDQSPEGL